MWNRERMTAGRDRQNLGGEYMPSGVFKKTQRKDMMPPCNGCTKRYPGCHDHCKDPEYMKWKRLMDLKRQDEQARSQKSAADVIPSEERYRGRRRRHG